MTNEFIDNEVNFSEELEEETSEVFNASEDLVPMPIAKVAASLLNFRKAPNRTAPVIRVIKAADPLYAGPYFDRNADMVNVKLADGTEGYVAAEYVEWV